MDWAKAIEHKRQALLAIVTSLFDMLELVSGQTLVRLPPRLHRAVLRVLGPAESAVRRLVVIAARGVVAKPRPSRPMPSSPIERKSGSRLAFQLFDPPMCAVLPGQGHRQIRRGGVDMAGPRVHVFGPDPRIGAFWQAPRPAVPAPPPTDGSVDAARLCRRLYAVRQALDDIPHQARRLVRWRMRRQSRPGQKSASPLRLGRPPAMRRKPSHDVDRILAECHYLARLALASDTS